MHFETSADHGAPRPRGGRCFIVTRLADGTDKVSEVHADEARAMLATESERRGLGAWQRQDVEPGEIQRTADPVSGAQSVTIGAPSAAARAPMRARPASTAPPRRSAVCAARIGIVVRGGITRRDSRKASTTRHAAGARKRSASASRDDGGGGSSSDGPPADSGRDLAVESDATPDRTGGER